MKEEQTKLTMDTKSPPPIIYVSGTYQEMGQQIGEACTNQVRHGIESAQQLIRDAYEELQLTWDGAIIQAKKYLPFVMERYPQYVDELTGISDGAGVKLDDLIVVNAMEAVTMDALHLSRCTTIAVNGDLTADGQVFVAHNEDWLPDDEQDVFVVHATPNDAPPFLGMTYGGLLVNIGFNSLGIAQCCDTVYPSDSRIGVPRVFLSRAVLSARTPGEAIKLTIIPQRAAGYNHLIAHESGELYSVEVSARKYAILYAEDGYLVHTNHYLDSAMRQIESDPEEHIGSRVRYFRATRLLKSIQQHTIRSLQTIQKDHLNFPNSICNHLNPNDDPLDREKTINALVIDLSARAMHIAWGNPCQSQYHTYYLEA